MRILKRMTKWFAVLAVCFGLLFGLYFNCYRYLIPNAELANHNSAFMKRHSRDLVLWKKFNEASMNDAKQRNKPLFLFAGYHSSQPSERMQQLLFKHPLIAKSINRYFVPVLIDRFEQPELNDIYLNIMGHQLNRKSWPLIAILTTDGIPLFMSPGINPNSIIDVINQIRSSWQGSPDLMNEQLRGWGKEYAAFYENRYRQQQPVNDPMVALSQFLSQRFDTNIAGLRGPIKFSYLYYFRELLNISPDFYPMVKQTVHQLLESPMFDFIDGGIFTYSIYGDWTRPQFEKSLMDQIRLVQLLIELHEVTKDPTYLDVAEVTMRFAFNYLQAPSGLFRMSLNTGPMDKRGEYYLFSDSFLDSMIPLSFKRISAGASMNVVALARMADATAVDVASLQLKRKNNGITLMPDDYICLSCNAIALEVLNHLNRYRPNDQYKTTMNQIAAELTQVTPSEVSLHELLIIYDVLIHNVESVAMTPFENEIKSRLGTRFPFVKKPFDFISQDIQFYDYFDKYHMPQPLTLLLKHRGILLPDYSKTDMCNNVTPVIQFHWEQLSLIKLLKNACG